MDDANERASSAGLKPVPAAFWRLLSDELMKKVLFGLPLSDEEYRQVDMAHRSTEE